MSQSIVIPSRNSSHPWSRGTQCSGTGNMPSPSISITVVTRQNQGILLKATEWKWDKAASEPKGREREQWEIERGKVSEREVEREWERYKERKREIYLLFMRKMWNENISTFRGTANCYNEYDFGGYRQVQCICAFEYCSFSSISFCDV